MRSNRIWTEKGLTVDGEELFIEADFGSGPRGAGGTLLDAKRHHLRSRRQRRIEHPNVGWVSEQGRVGCAAELVLAPEVGFMAYRKICRRPRGGGGA